MILYLRVVYSVDYYNHGEYPNEDEMPNRCGLIHVRGPIPFMSQGAVTDEDTGEKVNMLSASFVHDYQRSIERKLESMLNPKERINEDEAEQLGKFVK